MINFPILSTLLWLPTGFAVVALLINQLSETIAKWTALVGSIVVFMVSIIVYFYFDTTISEMQFVEQRHWISAFNIDYYLGIDGIALPLILLTTFITIIAIASSWESIKTKITLYFVCFLFLETFILGVFMALDSILFYVFWEALLIPMFLIIGIWGGERRVYAAIKFFLFTFVGSVFMLIAFIYLYFISGSFSILDFQIFPLELLQQQWLFWAFFLAFAVKIPMVLVHTWLPDAHVEAPTAGSIILAAVLLKIGGYGFIRLSLPVVPDASALFAEWVIVLSLIAIVYIGFVALVQKDMKKLIAYSSISHMGFVTLALFVVFSLYAFDTSISELVLQGAMVQMISHGFISAALFMLIGVLYDRLHSRNIVDYGGVATVMPSFAFFVVLFAMANAGLPGTSGFVGEFMIIISVVQSNFWYAVLASLTLILGAAYTLWMVKRVMFGKPTKIAVLSLLDISIREKILLSLLAFFVILLGVYPNPLIEVMDVSVEHLISSINTSKRP